AGKARSIRRLPRRRLLCRRPLRRGEQGGGTTHRERNPSHIVPLPSALCPLPSALLPLLDCRIIRRIHEYRYHLAHNWSVLLRFLGHFLPLGVCRKVGPVLLRRVSARVREDVYQGIGLHRIVL